MKKVKCSTVSVTLNSVLIQDRIGLSPVGWGAEFTEKERLICDEVYDTPGDPKAYCKASGIILFQEHDTPVQFQKIEIDPTWKPMSGGSFYESWQRFEPPAGTCKPRV